MNIRPLCTRSSEKCALLIRNLSETRAAEYRNKMIGFIFQSFNLINFKTAVENVELPRSYQGVSRRKRHTMAMEYLEKPGLQTGLAIILMKCRADRNNVLPLPVP